MSPEVQTFCDELCRYVSIIAFDKRKVKGLKIKNCPKTNQKSYKDSEHCQEQMLATERPRAEARSVDARPKVNGGSSNRYERQLTAPNKHEMDWILKMNLFMFTRSTLHDRLVRSVSNVNPESMDRDDRSSLLTRIGLSFLTSKPATTIIHGTFTVCGTSQELQVLVLNRQN